MCDKTDLIYRPATVLYWVMASVPKHFILIFYLILAYVSQFSSLNKLFTSQTAYELLATNVSVYLHLLNVFSI